MVTSSCRISWSLVVLMVVLMVVNGCYRSFLDATGQVDRASIQAVFSKTWVLHLWESNSTYFNIIIFLKWKAVETSWNILEHLETSWNHFNLQISSVCLRGHGFSVLLSASQPLDHPSGRQQVHAPARARPRQSSSCASPQCPGSKDPLGHCICTTLGIVMS